MDAPFLSEKARGKKRALDQDEDNDADVAEMQMELDNGSSSSSSEGEGEPTTSRAKRHDAGTPSSSRRSMSTEMGGSVSRAARMRATTTEDEAGSGSEDSQSVGDSEASDNDANNPLLETGISKNGKKLAKGSSLSKSFVTASNGEAYLSAMSRPAKTSSKKLSESWSDPSKPFTQSSLLSALSNAASSAKAKATDRKLQQLEDAYTALHEQWFFELEQGFSVFFHGLGSKIRVMKKFVTSHLKRKRKRNGGGQKGEVVVINGYMANLGMDDVLNALEGIIHRDTISKEELSDIQSGKSAAKLDERAKNLVESLSNSPRFGQHRPIYLIVHNIDGIALRSYRSQAILSLLASQPQIRLMASIDHVKAPLLFPSALATARPSSSLPHNTAPHSNGADNSSSSPLGAKGYNIIYHHLPTFRPYTIESLLSGTFSTIFPPSLFISDSTLATGGMSGLEGQSSEARAKAAYFVLASLTQKSKDVFSLLAERQISLASSSTSSSKKKTAQTSMNKENPPPHSTLYATLFSLARDRFLANNVNQFEALLRELRDHDVLLSSNRRPEGLDGDGQEEEEGNEGDREEVGQRSGEWVWIAIEREELEELLERLKT